jgi:hypothetical protein
MKNIILYLINISIFIRINNIRIKSIIIFIIINKIIINSIIFCQAGSISLGSDVTSQGFWILGLEPIGLGPASGPSVLGFWISKYNYLCYQYYYVY